MGEYPGEGVICAGIAEYLLIVRWGMGDKEFAMGEPA
jgi:hypothetical protein